MYYFRRRVSIPKLQISLTQLYYFKLFKYSNILHKYLFISFFTDICDFGIRPNIRLPVVYAVNLLIYVPKPKPKCIFCAAQMTPSHYRFLFMILFMLLLYWYVLFELHKIYQTTSINIINILIVISLLSVNAHLLRPLLAWFRFGLNFFNSSV